MGDVDRQLDKNGCRRLPTVQRQTHFETTSIVLYFLFFGTGRHFFAMYTPTVRLGKSGTLETPSPP